MKLRTKPRLRGRCKVKSWVQKGRAKQKGGFISLIIAGLISLGVAAETAASVAAVATPVITGALSATGGIVASKVFSGKGKCRTIRRIRR